MQFKSIAQLLKRNLPIIEVDGPLEELRNRKVLVNGFRLLLWHELPTQRRDNKFILIGYRLVSGSFCQSLKSLSHIYNETVNIYTYILGAVLFGTLLFSIYNKVYRQYTNTQLSDIIIFSTFFQSVAVYFLLSASFHIVSNHSAAITALSNHLDYLSIVILIWGSIIPSVYYGFYYEPKL